MLELIDNHFQGCAWTLIGLAAIAVAALGMFLDYKKGR
jgi:hypothetical protein